MPLIKINSKIRHYNVHFGDFNKYLEKIDKISPINYYIIDANVWKLYRKIYLKNIDDTKVIVLPISEDKKNLNTVIKLYDNLIESSIKRNMILFCIGGGTTQDISGFLASTLYRGIRWVFIPTTLLAQADSCIGGKTSLNYKNFKNIIGTFYPPEEVFIDTDFLFTQNKADFFNGLGEVVKLHILGGKDNIQKILGILQIVISQDKEALKTAVHNSLLIKKGYIEEDEFDIGRRNLLNYGHCFGHALETASDFDIPHGQAVILGMILSNIVARRRCLLSKKLESFVLKELFSPVLIKRPKKSSLKPEAIILAMEKDKKRTGKGFPLIIMNDGYGITKLNDVNKNELRDAINEMIMALDISIE